MDEVVHTPAIVTAIKHVGIHSGTAKVVKPDLHIEEPRCPNNDTLAMETHFQLLCNLFADFRNYKQHPSFNKQHTALDSYSVTSSFPLIKRTHTLQYLHTISHSEVMPLIKDQSLVYVTLLFYYNPQNPP